MENQMIIFKKTIFFIGVMFLGFFLESCGLQSVSEGRFHLPPGNKLLSKQTFSGNSINDSYTEKSPFNCDHDQIVDPSKAETVNFSEDPSIRRYQEYGNPLHICTWDKVSKRSEIAIWQPHREAGQGWDRACVIPLVQSAEGLVPSTYPQDPNMIVYLCGALSADGLTLHFQNKQVSLKFNAAYLVPEVFVFDLLGCLSAQDSTTCPSISFFVSGLH